MYQLENGRSVLDRYRSRRSSDGRKEMVGVRISPEVRERLETIAKQERTTVSTILRSLAREAVLTAELSDLDGELVEAIAVESLKDIEDWYGDDDAVATTAAQLRSIIDTTTEN